MIHQIIDFFISNLNYYRVSAGLPFTKHYFNMNERCLSNDLYKLVHSRQFPSNGMAKPDIVFKFSSDGTSKVDDL